MNKVEILSPCGDYNCFLSAINAGCDAVYLSGNKYGARAYADNFSQEELILAINYAHLFSVKVYLTVNTLAKNSEISELYDFLLPLYMAGLDGVIVQDIGIISYIRKHFPLLPVHASTQMAITGKEGVELLKKLGVTRVVLAREVSLYEIEKIYRQTNMDIECFVHGALCYSYSGKCLFSSLIGGRSGNRGRCAGPCRQPYNNEQYLLSTKDICCLKLIPKLIKAGIVSFKIEGRMKSPEYVAGVTGIFRKHLDRYYWLLEKFGVEEAERKFYEDKSLNEDFNTLVKLYTRGGNSEGYYFNKNGRHMISLKDASYQTGDEELKKEIYNQYSKNRKYIVNAKISINTGEYACLDIYDGNNSVCVTGPMVQKSENRPLDKDTVKKQLTKTGDSPFIINNIEYDISNDSFMRVSEINDLRRVGLNAFWEKCLIASKREKPEIISEIIDDFSHSQNNDLGPIYNAEVHTLDQLKAAANSPKINIIYLPFSFLLNNGFSFLKEYENTYGKKIYVKFHSVIRNDFFENYKKLLTDIIENTSGILIDNYELLQYMMDNGYKGEIVGDVHIYGLNDIARNELKGLGFSRITVPVELNKKEISAMSFSDDEIIIYGRLPMMVSAQCVNNTLNGCNSSEKLIKLKDRKKADFIAVNDCSVCENTIYNSLPLSLHGEAGFLEKNQISNYRIIFTDENFEESQKLIEDYTGNALMDSNYPIKFTKGHFNRGVL